MPVAMVATNALATAVVASVSGRLRASKRACTPYKATAASFRCGPARLGAGGAVPRSHTGSEQQMVGDGWSSAIHRALGQNDEAKAAARGELFEDDDANASIEPCLVGWSDVDDNGVEVYCCEQPGGAMECKTLTPRNHQECAIVDGPDGKLTVNCNPKLKADAGMPRNFVQKMWTSIVEKNGGVSAE